MILVFVPAHIHSNQDLGDIIISNTPIGISFNNGELNAGVLTLTQADLTNFKIILLKNYLAN